MTYTLDDMIEAVQYGFMYREESMHDGISVPVGNILQWIMSRKNLSEVPPEFRDLKIKQIK